MDATDIRLVETRGCAALVGRRVDDFARSAGRGTNPDHSYHITLFAKSEVRQLGKKLDTLMDDPPTIRDVINLGIGHRANVTFLVIYWAQGNILRKQLGLAEKQFHITLSTVNNHDIEKSVDSIAEAADLDAESVAIIVRGCLASLQNFSSSRATVVQIVRFVVLHHHKLFTDSSFDGAWRLLCRSSTMDEASDLAFAYLSCNSSSIAAHMRVADSLTLPQHAKEAMLHYANAASLALRAPLRSDVVVSACVEGIVRCARDTEYGPAYSEQEALARTGSAERLIALEDAWDTIELQHLVQAEVSKINDLHDLESLLLSHPSVPPNRPIFVPLPGLQRGLYKLPRFFRWMVPYRLALMSIPRRKDDITALISTGIRLVITLSEESPLPPSWFEGTRCRNVLVPIRDFCAPTCAQVDSFIKMMDVLPPDEAALVHCAGGKGRTGVFAACYLMARGLDSTKTDNDGNHRCRMYPADAIRFVRHMRPPSIESHVQEAFVRKYAQHLLSDQHAGLGNEPAVLETEDGLPLELRGNLPHSPSIIVLCGLPGSGKSTFGAALAKHLQYTVICQDELGTRAACLNALSNSLQSNCKVVIDRCNPYPEDREEWLAYAFHPEDALCIWFDIEPSLCVRRVDGRANHPKIAPGRGSKIVNSFSKTFVAPDVKEKFACVARVPSTDAAHELLTLLGIPAVDQDESAHTTQYDQFSPSACVPVSPLPRPEVDRQFIYKFPRTRHLFNLGSASRDDLILDPSDALAFLDVSNSSTTLTLEEKVDGANVGITADDTSISGFKVQNRSHYVSSTSHAQFKKLDSWLVDHRAGLDIVLRGHQGQFPAGRYVLYGEWLYAKHSIHYSKLPDLFLAFDLFDTTSGMFCTRDVLRNRLAGTNVQQVCSVEKPERLDEESLLNLVKLQESRYYDGIIEGLYLRREQDGKTVDRAKIVREGFIAGNEHWSRGSITPNIIAHV